MIKSLVYKIFGSKNERELRRLWPIVERINTFESTMQQKSDSDLQQVTLELKSRLSKGETLDEVLPEAFAAVREASKRVLGMRHFDVQLLGGIILHQGKVAEMKTGEGKTLVATLPAYLNALSGLGVHVVTVNDYLAKRDSEWMGRIYSFLGLSTGVVVHSMGHGERKIAYNADITYGQNNEFGFDYLRDNMKLELEEMVQRPHNFAVVDEVDSILIDEARTPLIISGPADDATESYLQADKIVRKLSVDRDFTVELKSKQVLLTDEGVKRVEELLEINNLYDLQNTQTVHHVTQALKAHATMNRDVEYVVRGGQIIIVDEFTGRMMPGRRWSDGLHQAIEAKEGVKIQQENQTLATITFQNYFRLYKKLSGMTGTADTEAVELKKIYKLDVVVVPPNKPMVRTDNPDVVFPAERGKLRAVCDEIEELHEKGQPVLVGTASIEKSELIAKMLSERGIEHNVLNAKNHEREAEIIAQAGRLGAVTISTNMAGRGTDILLGGNAEFLAAAEAETKDPADPNFQAALVKYRAECEAEHAEVIAAGGLHVLGTERHESRRIDNQLRGRAGRQGDPGSSRFYVSLQDDLMKRFGGDKMQAFMERVGVNEDDAVEGKIVAASIERAQKKVEGYHFDIRKHLIEYDDVMNKQREVVYSLRNKILRSVGVREEIEQMAGDVIENIVMLHADEKIPTFEWNLQGIFDSFKNIFGVDLPREELKDRQEHAGKEFAQEIYDHAHEIALSRLAERATHFGQDRLDKLARIVFLQALDHFWKEHLTNMEHLREGIGLRGYGQKNPLQEYQKEAFDMFTSMMHSVKTAVTQHVYVPELPSDQEIRELEERERRHQEEQEKRAATIHEELPGASSQNPEEKNEEELSGNRHDRRRLARESRKTKRRNR